MKAKVYPLTNIPNEISAKASIFCLHLEIICASLAQGTSFIKNLIDCNEIKSTINWCKSLGASIKESNGRLIIKGTANNIDYKHSLFTCDNSTTTAKLLIPILCTIQQPFGVKFTNKAGLEEILTYKHILEAYGVSIFVENDMVRFENKMKAIEYELNCDFDTAFAAGLLMAFPLINGLSILRLRAPIRNEKNYSTLLKIFKKFHINVKHPATMRYEINGYQYYKKAKVSTEIDCLHLSYLGLISQKLNFNSKISVLNYKKDSTQDSLKLIDFMKKNVFILNSYFGKKNLKKKEIDVHSLTPFIENSLPIFMVLATLNKQDTIITGIDEYNKKFTKQLNTMTKIFTKLKLNYALLENELIIKTSKVEEKKQVESGNDPYIVMAITILALLSEVPIVIKNAECINEINSEFFEDLRSYGAEIEYIHD